MGCLTSQPEVELSTKFPNLPQLSVDSRIYSNNSYWLFSKKHQLSIIEACDKSMDLQLPNIIIQLIQSYFTKELLIILSRTDKPPKYIQDEIGIKVCVLGGTKVGKSTFINRVVRKQFELEYNPNIEEYDDTTIYVGGIESQPQKIEFLDTGGEFAFGFLNYIWVKESRNFIVTYDLTNFESYKQMKSELDKIKRLKSEMTDAISELAIVILGLKGDLILDSGEFERCVPEEEIIEFCKSKNLPYIECSAKDNINVNIAIEHVLMYEINCFTKLNS